MLQVAIPVFARFTALDGIGPYEVLQRIPELHVTFVGHRRGEVRRENRMLGIAVDATFDEMVRPDVIVFPGGVGTRSLPTEERVLGWLRAAHAPASSSRMPASSAARSSSLTASDAYARRRIPWNDAHAGNPATGATSASTRLPSQNCIRAICDAWRKSRPPPRAVAKASSMRPA